MPLLLGKPIATALLTATADMIRSSVVQPGLAVILVGSDTGSEIYVRLKREAAERIGIRCVIHRFSAAVSLATLEECIMRLNADPTIHGIILQLPLPPTFDPDPLVRLIDPDKDADGFHPRTLAHYLAGDDDALPVLPHAIESLILSVGRVLTGEPSVALVNSELFGRVINYTLTHMGLVPTVVMPEALVRSPALLQQAHVVVSVCGEPGLVDLGMLRSDAIVIDAGITRVESAVRGDVEGDLMRFSGWVTPVPGGVGPVTIATLLSRVARLAIVRHSIAA